MEENMLRRLSKDKDGHVSFALLGVLIMVLSVFSGAYMASVSNSATQYRIKQNEVQNLQYRSEKALNDLKSHAEFFGYRSVLPSRYPDGKFK
jgi:hypothetical protein